jgi:hypothetical protein
MNTSHRSLCCILLAMSATACFGSSAVPTGAAASVSAPRPAELAGAQAVLAQRNVEHSYQMSNGRQLDATFFGEVVRVRYARHAPIVLRHDGQGHFVSNDGSVTLAFAVNAFGDVESLSLSAPGGWL